MWTHAQRYDRAFQEARFASDFLEFGRSGRVYLRADAIRDVGPRFEAQLPLDGLVIRELGSGVAQLTYRSHAAYPGEPVEHANRSSIWTWSPELGWQMRFHQGTPISA